jgi:hypothetical protein
MMGVEPLPLEAADRELRRAFAPWHKLALGLALGLTAALVTAAVTVFHVVMQPPTAPNLALLSEFFYGYTVTWAGVLVGAWWSFVVGFIAGFFTAFVVNFCLATWLLVVKAKADLSQTTDFLDHI